VLRSNYHTFGGVSRIIKEPRNAAPSAARSIAYPCRSYLTLHSSWKAREPCGIIAVLEGSEYLRKTRTEFFTPLALDSPPSMK
jgi:hypothetical protein